MQSNSLKIRFYNLLKDKRIILIYIPLVIYWVVLLILTSIPTDSLPTLFGLSDKVEHFGAYLLLSVFITAAFHFQKRYIFISKHYLIMGILVATLYGILDEIHQYFIPGRYCELWDFIANLLGSIVGGVFFYKLIKYLTIHREF